MCVPRCPAPFGASTVLLADRIYVMEVENMDMQEGPQALSTVSLSWWETLQDLVRLVRRWWTSLDPCWSRRTPKNQSVRQSFARCKIVSESRNVFLEHCGMLSSWKGENMSTSYGKARATLSTISPSISIESYHSSTAQGGGGSFKVGNL